MFVKLKQTFFASGKSLFAFNRAAMHSILHDTTSVQIQIPLE